MAMLNYHTHTHTFRCETQPWRVAWWEISVAAHPVVPAGPKTRKTQQPRDWIGFLGKILTGNHGFYHEICGFPVNFPVNQSNDHGIGLNMNLQDTMFSYEIWWNM